MRSLCLLKKNKFCQMQSTECWTSAEVNRILIQLYEGIM